MILYTSLVCAFLIFFILALILLWKHDDSIDIFHRLRFYIDDSSQQLKSQISLNPANETPAEKFLQLLRKISQPLQKFHPIDTYDRLMRRSGFPITGAEFIMIMLWSFIILGGFSMMLTLDYIFAISIGVTAVIAEYSFVLWTVNRRRTIFSNQLGDCLTTVSNALRAGYSFMQAMDLISREMEPPISEEFAQAMQEVSAGMPIENALNSMDQRVQNADFSLMITAVLIQREVGGNLAQILDSISETIDERIRMKREIKALTAQGRMSGYVLGALPIFLIGFLNTISPGHFNPILESEFAPFIIGGCVFMEILGFLVIQRIVDIDI